MFPHLDRAWSFGVLSDIKVWSTIPRSSKSQPSHLPHKSSLSLLVTIPSFPPSLHPIHSSFKRIHLVFCSFLASIKAVSKAPKCNRPRSRNCNASTAKGQVKSMEGATLLLGGMLRSDLFWGGKNQRRTCGTWMMSHGLVKSKKWRTLHTGGGVWTKQHGVFCRWTKPKQNGTIPPTQNLRAPMILCLLPSQIIQA